MELVSIILSGLFSIFAIGGFAIDKNIEANLRSQLEQVEQLQVRVDNAPVHQVIGGKINKMRIAGKGVWFTKEVRIESLAVETDPIDVNLPTLKEDLQAIQSKPLPKPIQAAVKLVFNERDINQALRSPVTLDRIQRITSSTLDRVGGSLGKDYQILTPQVKFLANNRLGMTVVLKDRKSGEQLNVELESGVQVLGGKKFQLVDPIGKVNGTEVPPFILSSLTSNLSERINLDFLSERGLTARILQLQVKPQQLEIAAFVRLTGVNKSERANSKEQ
jgi:hypothetical protein